MFEWVHWEYGVRSYSHKGHTHEDTSSNYLSWNVDTYIILTKTATFEPLKTKPTPRSTSLDCDAGEFGMSGQGQWLLKLVTWMILIWSASEERKRREKREREMGEGWRERERDAWSINSSKYFLRLLVFIKFSWPFELWEWNVNVQKHWRHCKMYFPLQCQAFHITQGSLIHIWVSLRPGQVDICSENSGTHDAFGQ